MRRAILCLLVCVGCRTSPAPAAPPMPPAWGRLEPGPHRVGVSVRFEVDSSRPALGSDSTAVTGMGRPMQIVVWYPAADAGSRRLVLRDYVEMSAGTLGAAEVTPESSRAALDTFTSVPRAAGMSQERVDSLLRIEMSASFDARHASGRFPLIIFLHARPWGASVLSEYLASHGFVVAAIESKGARTSAYRLSHENLDAMTRDAAFVVARMRRAPHVDDRLGVIGMSNGSIAALALQLTGIVPRGLVSLDGGIGEGAGGRYVRERTGGDSTRLSVPLLHLYSPDNRFLDFSYVRSYIAAERALVRVGHLRHGDFLAGGALERVVPGWLGPAPPNVVTGFEMVCRFTRSFLRTYVAGDQTPAEFLSDIQANGDLPADFLSVDVLPAVPPVR